MSHDAILKHRQNPPAECRIQLAGTGLHIGRSGRRLTQQFGLSRRQAYRYLQEAQQIDAPALVASPSIPITIKIPADVVKRLQL